MNEEMSARDRAEARATSRPENETTSGQPDAQARARAVAGIAAMYRSMDEFLAAHVVTQDLLETKISV